MLEEIVRELIQVENQLEDWSEEMIIAIDSESHGPKAERAMKKVRACVETCRQAFAEIHREFEKPCR